MIVGMRSPKTVPLHLELRIVCDGILLSLLNINAFNNIT